MILVGALAAVAVAADDRPSEYAIKAAFLYKFGDFVTWPDGAFAAPDSPIVLCIAGNDPFGALLDDATKGQSVGAHAIVVRRMPVARRDVGCHVLYAAGSLSQNPDAALAAVRGTPTLTVTDENQNAGTPGVIHLVMRNNRVRLEVDQQAAAENGLTISSKLLNVAIAVRPRRGN